MRLHPGTIISPTGLTLAPGMVVSVLGYNAGSYFAANQIDTPYRYDAGVPYYAGHPWNYYGPTVGLSFYFGNAGWWHSGYLGGGYRYLGGARVYNRVRVNEIYRRPGGSYHGRDFVAPHGYGGYCDHVHHGGQPHHGEHPWRDHH